ncbi:hypothetical protein SteCoe_26320 [Stentor coeruleus]|uniref:Uncharacterized protein n=1 Tax=Stentor coeruleus TaxID=5963 RepID=A0A1R2BD76_9CILI|nr:hypothetical protein SteCoe_26320 [Stentor coeruleus]
MNKLVQIFKKCCSAPENTEIEEAKNDEAEKFEEISPPQELEKQEESTFISDKTPESIVTAIVKKPRKSVKTEKKEKNDKRRKSRKSEEPKIRTSLANANPIPVPVVQPTKPLEAKPLKGILKKPKKFF